MFWPTYTLIQTKTDCQWRANDYVVCRKYGRLFNTLTHSNRNTCTQRAPALTDTPKTHSNVAIVIENRTDSHTLVYTQNTAQWINNAAAAVAAAAVARLSWKSLESWTVKRFNEQNACSIIAKQHYKKATSTTFFAMHSNGTPNSWQDMVSKFLCLSNCSRFRGAKSQ